VTKHSMNVVWTPFYLALGTSSSAKLVVFKLTVMWKKKYVISYAVSYNLEIFRNLTPKSSEGSPHMAHGITFVSQR